MAVGATAAAAAVFLAQIHDLPLLGWDTAPEIASSRILDAGDLLGTFTESTTDGIYPYLFYRPVFNLSLAFDYALWGTRPLGYHLSCVFWVACCGLALFALGREIFGRAAWVGPLTALLAFLFTPALVDILPVPSRRMDAICGVFSLLALRAEIRFAASGRRSWRLAAALGTALAAGAKEAGFVLPPLMFALNFALARELRWVARLRAALVGSGPHFVAVGLVLALRFAALGELGGHPSTHPIGMFTRLPEALGRIVDPLLFALVSGKPTVGGALRLLEGVSLVVVIWGIARLLPRTTAPAVDRGALLGEPGVGAGLAATWLLGLAMIAGATGIVQVWHLLLPALAFSLGFGALAEASARRVQGAGRALPSAAALVLVLASLGVLANRSPLFRSYDHWHRASSETQTFLDHFERNLRATPPGKAFTVGRPPSVLAFERGPLGRTLTTPINIYSLPSWALLHVPDRRVSIPYLREGRWPYHDAPVRLTVEVQPPTP